MEKVRVEEAHQQRCVSRDVDRIRFFPFAQLNEQVSIDKQTLLRRSLVCKKER